MKEFKILVAEDNHVNQRLIEVILEKSGFQFEMVSNGIEAVDRFQKSQFQLILMDCQMPEMDGISASKKIRTIESESNLSRTPIVALTANSMNGDREKCIESGMDDFLAKPFLMKQLLEVIEIWKR